MALDITRNGWIANLDARVSGAVMRFRYGGSWFGYDLTVNAPGPNQINWMIELATFNGLTGFRIWKADPGYGQCLQCNRTGSPPGPPDGGLNYWNPLNQPDDSDPDRAKARFGQPQDWELFTIDVNVPTGTCLITNIYGDAYLRNVGGRVDCRGRTTTAPDVLTLVCDF